MNAYDSQKLFAILKTLSGFEQTDRPEQVDLLILNTCSIREKAQENLFYQLGRWKAFKARENPR